VTDGGVVERSEPIGTIWTHTVTRAGPVTTITLFGEVDFTGRDAIAEIIVAEVGRPGVDAVAIDMSPVSFLGSAGARALLIGYRAAKALGRRYTVSGFSGATHQVLDLTGVLAAIEGDRDAAANW
jgi:anti-anti-sigma factor